MSLAETTFSPPGAAAAAAAAAAADGTEEVEDRDGAGSGARRRGHPRDASAAVGGVPAYKHDTRKKQ